MAWNDPAPVRGMPSVSPHGRGPSGFGRNYLKTAALMGLLIAVLAIGGQMAGGTGGMLLFGGIGLVINFVSYWFSDRIALMAHRAREVTRPEAPQLFESVEKLTRKAGLPMPRVYVIPTMTPNAFATGRNPRHAAVAVTEGILKLLDRRQLEGVLAHELAHVQNRDILIATVAAAVAGLVASLGHVIQWGAILGYGRSSDDDRGNPIAAIAWALLAPIVAMIIQLAVSRSREYGADASGAELCGDPDALADALETLERGNQAIPYDHAGPATAHFFIVSPLRGGAGAGLARLFSTHPPVEERVARLRAMRRGVRYA